MGGNRWGEGKEEGRKEGGAYRKPKKADGRPPRRENVRFSSIRSVVVNKLVIGLGLSIQVISNR